MTDKEKLEKAVKLADAMYYAAQYLTTDASRLRKAMDAYHKFIIYEYNKQEPASEDLEKEIDRYFNTEGIPVTGGALRDTARHFAQWQKEQMIKDAIECHIDYYDGPILNFTQKQLDDALEKNGAKIGDKVKVIIIKE